MKPHETTKRMSQSYEGNGIFPSIPSVFKVTLPPNKQRGSECYTLGAA